MNLRYTTPERAVEEANRRLRDKELQRRVEQYLGNIWPRGFDDVRTPAAVFAPYLARGSDNEIRSLAIAQRIGVNGAVANYVGAEYVTANTAAVDCYRVPLKLPKGQQRRLWVVPEEDRSGKIGEARTIYPDVTISQYATGIRTPALEANVLPTDTPVVDFGEWYDIQAKRFGWSGERQKSPFYYMASMALYASGRAILMDTPPTAYASNVMAPAAESAEQALGVYPLITNELQDGRDWTDVSFLNEREAARLVLTGRIG